MLVSIVVCDGCGLQIPSTSPFDCVTAKGLNAAAQYQEVHFGEPCGCAAKIRAGAAYIEDTVTVQAAVSGILAAAPPLPPNVPPPTV